MLEDVIKSLNQKLNLREDTIHGLTTGYLKDVQHLREMVFRSSNFDEHEFYEVQYFDISSTLDEQTAAILNSKIKTLKMAYEEKTRSLVKKLVALSEYSNELKVRVQNLESIINRY